MLKETQKEIQTNTRNFKGNIHGTLKEHTHKDLYKTIGRGTLNEHEQ